MPTNEQLTRLGIFLAVGYLCAGIVVSVFAGLPLWAGYFNSEFLFIALITVITMAIGAALGIALMRFLVPRYGIKTIFEQDVLILMIGLLFLALAMNPAMLAIGLIVAVGAGAVYFFENFNVQLKAVTTGGISVLTLAGWAVGPVVAVAALTAFSDLGLLTLRLIFAHYIIIAFWVWVQRLGLHENFAEAPASIHKLYQEFQEQRSSMRRQDKYNHETRHGSIPLRAPGNGASAAASTGAAPGSASSASSARTDTGISTGAGSSAHPADATCSTSQPRASSPSSGSPANSSTDSSGAAASSEESAARAAAASIPKKKKGFFGRM